MLCILCKTTTSFKFTFYICFRVLFCFMASSCRRWYMSTVKRFTHLNKRNKILKKNIFRFLFPVVLLFFLHLILLGSCNVMVDDNNIEIILSKLKHQWTVGLVILYVRRRTDEHSAHFPCGVHSNDSF